MISHETYVRVLYAETDQMGFVYYGNYPRFYELGRTEMIRAFGISYDQMEKDGIAMPVIDLQIKYKKPAVYDDLLRIKTTVTELPATRITFKYEIFNEKDILLNVGVTTLIFLDLKNNRPRRAPDYLVDMLKPHFESSHETR